MPIDRKKHFAELAGTDFYKLLTADFWDRCESPIERLMLAELLGLQNSPAGLFTRVADVTDWKAEIERIKESPEYVGTWVHIIPQARINRRRGDFLVLLSDDRNNGWPEDQRLCRVARIVVECDSRIYHQDEAKERQRDLEINIGTGLSVMHFWGWEIHHRFGTSSERVLMELCDRLWPDTHLRFNITKRPYRWDPPEDNEDAEDPNPHLQGEIIEVLTPVQNRMAGNEERDWFSWGLGDDDFFRGQLLWMAASQINALEAEGGAE